ARFICPISLYLASISIGEHKANTIHSGTSRNKRTQNTGTVCYIYLYGGRRRCSGGECDGKRQIYLLPEGVHGAAGCQRSWSRSPEGSRLALPEWRQVAACARG